MFTITKRFTFEAAHQLHGLPDGHQCGRLHGHSYAVELVLQSEALTPPGFVVDYGDLAPFANWVKQSLDHRNLNDVFAAPTTAENLARAMFDVARAIQPDWPLVAVRVFETAKTSAEYRP